MTLRDRTPIRDANPLLDLLKATLALKTDAALARRLALPIPAISKLRHCKIRVTPDMLISMHEETGLSIRELKSYLGVEIGKPANVRVAGQKDGHQALLAR